MPCYYISKYLKKIDVKILFFDVIQLRSNIKQKLSHFCVHDVNLYILLHHITLILIIMKGWEENAMHNAIFRSLWQTINI